MASIITYDIPAKHVEFKRTMFQLGYMEKIIHNSKWIYLPNTTLFHQTNTASQARNDVQRVAASLNQILERCISTQFGPDWAAIFGEPFKQ